tara:strand:- start:65 stop:694 length:630 start_codon:yes stop_codon:yes gene_type:complete
MKEIGQICPENLLKDLAEEISLSLPHKGKIKKEKLIYKNNHWLHILETEVNFEKQSDNKNIYSRIHRPNFTQIILSNDSGKYLFQLRYRIGCKDFVIEFPGGAIEKDESPINGVKRELKEELGLKENIKITPIGSCYMDPMRSDYKGYFFKGDLKKNINSFKKYVEGDLEESIFFWMSKNDIIKYFSLVASSSITALTMHNLFVNQTKL